MGGADRIIHYGFLTLLLSLGLTAHAKSPEQPDTPHDGLPEHFIGYWGPTEYPQQGPIGIHIHKNNRFSNVSNNDGKVLGRAEYKFICAPAADYAYILVRWPNSPSDIHYRSLSFRTGTSGINSGVPMQFLDISYLYFSPTRSALDTWNDPAGECPRMRKDWEATTPQYSGESIGRYWRSPRK